MSPSPIDILITSKPLPTSLIEGLQQEFRVHELPRKEERAAFLKEHSPKIRGLVCASGSMPIDKQLLDQLPQLKMIANFGIGVDAIDLDTARQRNITVTNTPKVLANAVAELALGLLLSVTRRIGEVDRFIRTGQWRKTPLALGTDLTGKTCGIVGMGEIGQAIAKRAEAFGMTIAYYGPRKKPDLPYPYYTDIKALAREADILMLSLPGGPETRRLINEDVMKALGSKGILINVARGSVVDEKALIRLLTSGELGAAGLDVFENEPHVPAEFLALDNVVLTPHIGSVTHETRAAMADLLLANVQAYFSGKPVLTKVN